MNDQAPLSSETKRSMVAVKVSVERTIKDLAKEALGIQDACNLSGIVHSFSRAMTDLRVIARAEGWEGTDKLNEHHIAVLFADKIASLVAPGSNIDGTRFRRAYMWASDIALAPETTEGR